MCGKWQLLLMAKTGTAYTYLYDFFFSEDFLTNYFCSYNESQWGPKPLEGGLVTVRNLNQCAANAKAAMLQDLFIGQRVCSCSESPKPLEGELVTELPFLIYLRRFKECQWSQLHP